MLSKAEVDLPLVWQVYVPANCGHGFFTFEDNTCALYLQEGTFNPQKEADTYPFDALVNVQWPVRHTIATSMFCVFLVPILHVKPAFSDVSA